MDGNYGMCVIRRLPECVVNGVDVKDILLMERGARSDLIGGLKFTATLESLTQVSLQSYVGLICLRCFLRISV